MDNEELLMDDLIDRAGAWSIDPELAAQLAEATKKPESKPIMACDILNSELVQL